MLTQTSKKEKKADSQTFITTGWKPIITGWKPIITGWYHQTKKKKEKKKLEKQTSHHQSLIWCKICEIPCYYQKIRYINNSNVRNTFGICGVKLRKRSVVGREALCYRDTMAWVGWPRSGEIVREEVRAVRASSWSTRMEMKLCFTEERSLRWETWREPLKRASKGAHHVNCFDCGTR